MPQAPSPSLRTWLMQALAGHPKAARVWRGLLLVLFCVITVLALLPADATLDLAGADKLNHMAAFAALAVVASLAYARAYAAIALGLLAYGGLIEVLQSFTPTRQAEWADLLADAAGIALGLLLASALALWARRCQGAAAQP